MKIHLLKKLEIENEKTDFSVEIFTSYGEACYRLEELVGNYPQRGLCHPILEEAESEDEWKCEGFGNNPNLKCHLKVEEYDMKGYSLIKN